MNTNHYHYPAPFSQFNSESIMLNQMQVGSHSTVCNITGGKAMLRKLMSLGIKSGSNIEILHRRGQGVVVRSNGTRIAIGESIAQHIKVSAAQKCADAV